LPVTYSFCTSMTMSARFMTAL
jgi:hypothetical protein